LRGREHSRNTGASVGCAAARSDIGGRTAEVRFGFGPPVDANDFGRDDVLRRRGYIKGVKELKSINK
jgi:hypothetical protein